jgi:protein TonB
MAYLQQASNNQKAVTMGAVAAIHAIAIYAVVSGLAVNVIPVIKERIIGVNIEKPKPTPPPPPPEQNTKPIDMTVKPQIESPPLPPLGNPLPPIDFGPTGGEIGAGGGEIAHVEFPTPPPPTPTFTAKGPKARGNSGNWVRESDYPTVAIRQELEGLTRVRLEVSTAGRVTDCVVTASSGHDVLDNAACAKLIERGRFNPATDTSGQAAAGTFNTSVRWQLPE